MIAEGMLHRQDRTRHVLRMMSVFIIVSGWLLAGCMESATVEIDAETRRLLDDALVTQEAGYTPLALAFVDSAISRQPNHATPHFIRAQFLSEMNKIDEAELAYKEVLQFDEEYQNVWFQLGDIAFAKREYSEALDRYEEEAALLDRKKSQYGTPFTVQYNESMSLLSLQRGRAHRQLGESEKARAEFASAIEFDSLNTAAYSDLSQAFQEAGQNPEALQYAQKALQQNPLNPDYLYQVGSLLYDNERIEESVPLLQGALQQKPWLSGAMYKLGLALVSMEEEETGTAYLKMADSLQAKNERIQKARFNAEKYADDPNQWVALARQLLEVGRVDEAMYPLNTAYSLDPENLSIQNDLANIALVGGDTALAKVRLEKILDTNPTFAEGWFNLGVINAMQGNYKEAQLHWENVIQLDPTHQEARDYLARLAE
ncbi:MAG: tetratricopeptide repeat protein [Rhodothermaceae bacterium]|nr:tetratricopeptide repeat protein [Rhodothermaceae bacterium]